MSRAAARLATWIPLVLVVLLAAVLVWELVLRSAIPRDLDGTINDIDVRTEDQPGVDDVWFITVADRTVRVDRSLGERLQVGDRVSKDRWSRRVLVDGQPQRLSLSSDAQASLWFAPLLVLGAVVLTLQARAPQRRSPTQ